VGWIEWGSQPQGLLIYRHMLAAPGFAQAIQNVPEPGRERAVMRGYYPRGRYLEGRAAFERRGCPA
jgi:hypothetical protein